MAQSARQATAQQAYLLIGEILGTRENAKTIRAKTGSLIQKVKDWNSRILKVRWNASVVVRKPGSGVHRAQYSEKPASGQTIRTFSNKELTESG